MNDYFIKLLGLKDVLEDARIAKLFFDCREDCNILQHSYGVKVQGRSMLKCLFNIQPIVKSILVYNF